MPLKYIWRIKPAQSTRVYRSGKLAAIWNPEAWLDETHILFSQYEKGELRVINLPNSRITELTTAISEKALGQVICLPSLQTAMSMVSRAWHIHAAAC